MPVFALIFLVFLIISSAVSSLLNRRLWHQGSLKRVLIVATAFGVIFCVCWAFLVAGVFVLLIEPWPLSLRQGPDTEYAAACFQRHIQQVQPPDIGAIYCREEWGFGGDSIYSIRFTFGASTTPHDIATALGLRLVSPERREGLRYLAGPKWWPLQEDLKLQEEVYERDGIDFLWVNQRSKQAYFQRANF